MRCWSVGGMVAGVVGWGPLCYGGADVPHSCSNAAARLADDYAFVVGSVDYADPTGDLALNSTYRWFVNGLPHASGPAAELLLLHLDGSLVGAAGETPTLSTGVAFEEGRWGQALALAPGGLVGFGRPGNLNLEEGTVEMWVAPRADGDDPVYHLRSHTLFLYRLAGGDYLSITQDGPSGVLFVGGTVGGVWQSAYSAAVGTRVWAAGEWHHLAYTYSAAEGFMRLYVDGVLVADNGEGHYSPPSGAANGFFVGGDLWGHEAYYLIDEVRLSRQPVPDTEIAARARRLHAAAASEAWLPTSDLDDGDVAVFAFLPGDGEEVGTPCIGGPVTYPGIPIVEVEPPSTVLPPGTSGLSITVRTGVETQCRYAVGAPLDLAEMTPFDAGAQTTQHSTRLPVISTNPNVVTPVYVRCDAAPDYLLRLKYRCLSAAEPSYPRTGNLWGSWWFLPGDLERAAAIDLWLGAVFSPGQIRALRDRNPDVRVLTSINAVENRGLPEDYYLHDIHGNRLEVWPGSFRLNMTKPYVAEYQARVAAQRILDSDLMVDGCFFDNVMTTQSWQDHDIHGEPFQYDHDEDGVFDDFDEFDAAWRAGLLHELETFRRLMPYALMSGHSMNVYEPGLAEWFNGVGIGFWTADVLEKQREFNELWGRLEAWHTLAAEPHVTMVESSPPDQIAYGYGYAPWEHVPPSTLEFARTYYPYVRFGLCLSLMQGAYFAHEFGDAWHGNDWWYDELDFDLGRPLGPARIVDFSNALPANLVVNGGFESPIDPPWGLWAHSGTESEATVSRDLQDAAAGTASARIDIGLTSGTDWHIDFAQFDRSLSEGQAYTVTFQAKSDPVRRISVNAQRSGPPWDNLGLWREILLDDTWRTYSLEFTANATTGQGRIQFLVGETTGSVWLDDVRMFEQAPYVVRRDFAHGIALLNPMRVPMQVEVGPGYRRLLGTQAPRHQYIIDDRDAAFAAAGEWTQVTYDSREWRVEGPYYHDWGAACHRSSGSPDAVARWELSIPQADTYTIAAWWPEAPSSGTWSGDATYEVVTGGVPVASTSLDQRTGGDEWHEIAELYLTPQDDAYVRVRSGDGARCIADALHVWSAGRYNDGRVESVVTLEPMDGIILRRYAAPFEPGPTEGGAAEPSVAAPPAPAGDSVRE